MHHIFEEIILTAILVTGLVVVMMMLIECFNVWSKGRFAGTFNGKGIGQVAFAAFLGAVPGCMGGFAAVSMYAHGMLSFGALVAMMIASCGDESFVMLAMIPGAALWIFAATFLLGIIVGIIIDAIHKPSDARSRVCADLKVHADERGNGERHFSWKRVVMFAGVAVFLAALAFGMLEHEHGGQVQEQMTLGGINLLSEDWMNVMFACFGVAVLFVIVFAGDHFVEEHLWHHIVREHLPRIFLWTFGALALIAVLLHYVDVGQWINDNVILMIVLAALVGIIPESGPHMLFVTLYAGGIAPLPVLVASCISQDGHAALPLLAEDKRAFIKAKAINCAVAILAGVLLNAFV